MLISISMSNPFLNLVNFLAPSTSCGNEFCPLVILLAAICKLWVLLIQHSHWEVKSATYPGRPPCQLRLWFSKPLKHLPIFKHMNSCTEVNAASSAIPVLGHCHAISEIACVPKVRHIFIESRPKAALYPMCDLKSRAVDWVVGTMTPDQRSLGNCRSIIAWRLCCRSCCLSGIGYVKDRGFTNGVFVLRIGVEFPGTVQVSCGFCFCGGVF